MKKNLFKLLSLVAIVLFGWACETDYYNEYVDMMRGDWTDRDFKEFLERYDFDYLLIEKDTKLETYLKDFQSDYASLLGTGNYVLWGRK